MTAVIVTLLENAFECEKKFNNYIIKRKIVLFKNSTLKGLWYSKLHRQVLLEQASKMIEDQYRAILTNDRHIYEYFKSSKKDVTVLLMNFKNELP